MELKLDGTAGIALIAFIVASIGSFLPWANVGPLLHVNGTAGDGQITLPVAVVGAFLVLIRQPALALIAALIIGGVGIYDAMNVADKASQVSTTYAISASIGFGLIMVAVSGCVAFLACLGMPGLTGNATGASIVPAPHVETESPVEIGKCSQCGTQIRSDAEQCYRCGIIFGAPPERVVQE